MKLHLIWDMDGTLVDSESEVIHTIEKSLEKVGVSVNDAENPLRIGPPVKSVIRYSFPESILSDEQLDDVVDAFREIYDVSEFKDTIPFEGIDEMVHSTDVVHHVITNKPNYATNRIILKKGWTGCFADVLCPNTLFAEFGRELNKEELFKAFRSLYPDVKAIGIGDMAKDAVCAHAVDIPAIGVLWGVGTKQELLLAGCEEVVSNADQLKEVLKKYKR